MSAYKPHILDETLEVVTPLILTYGTLTIHGGNCKSCITDLGGQHLGSFRLPEWLFMSAIAARYTGNPADFIIVDLFQFQTTTAEKLLRLWESQYKISVLEGQKLVTRSHRFYEIGLLKIDLSQITKDRTYGFAKIYPTSATTSRSSHRGFNPHAFSEKSELNSPILPCLQP